uniref:F-actin-capping protein subunit alpha n=1 Tax=Ditylum brightwellii TaxID=49249 RepID=A0A6V2QTW8_9STRA|mmetsp:Transcript_18856/g.24958  ORF Transcript_18856/g.24958 Transcript_18856/m.24958 type:complete len:271 (-) Transcript_18856:365-1177(-)
MPATSDDERKNIVQKILLSSPPGQFDLILADLKIILSSSSPASVENVLSADFIDSIRKEYNLKTSRLILENVNAEEGEEDDAFANALKRAMDSYMLKNFPPNNNTSKTTTTGGGVTSKYKVSIKTPSTEYEIVTYAERIHLKNYHAGSWNAKWTISLNSTGSEAVVNGVVSIHSHTFEDGNVQLLSSHNLGPASSSSRSGDPVTLAMGIVSRIGHWEREDVQGILGEMYDDMSGGMLKSLRRVMPVMRTRMEWNVVPHRMVKTLMERKEE